jgi:glycerol-3-phosphate dehydrogenase
MGGTKGSHIVLDNEELLAACAGRELFFENDDGRIVLIYPLMGRVLVGTTDLEADMSAPAVCTEEEVDYFFELVSHVFPHVHVGREQIVFRFAGVRPLPHHEDTQPGFVSRDYRIVEDSIPGLPKTKNLSLVGGKWTTFRALGEHLSNDVLAALGAERTVSTVGLAIGGGKDYPSTDDAQRNWSARYGADIGTERALVLLDRYGTKAREIIAFLGERDDRPLTAASEYSVGEIEYLAAHEHVVHLVDVLLRRTSVAFRGLLTKELASEIGDILARTLGWTEREHADELVAASRELEAAHGLRLDLGSVTHSA